jgi:hypothetical protein
VGRIPVRESWAKAVWEREGWVGGNPGRLDGRGKRMQGRGGPAVEISGGDQRGSAATMSTAEDDISEEGDRGEEEDMSM